MRAELWVLVAIIAYALLIGNAAAGATITFDKSIDVPDRTFEWNGHDFTITHVGNYKLDDEINVEISSGTDDMLIRLSTPKPLLDWWSTREHNTGGTKSVTIPANSVETSGTYGIGVENGGDLIGVNPVIISEYTLTVTPDKRQAEPGSTIKVTVNIKKSGQLFNVSNNVKVGFVHDPTYFEGTATKISTGTYEANITIPTTGSYSLYAAITTDKYLYQDYPEIIGAADGGTVKISKPSSGSSSVSGGGGGGGGGAGTSEPFENIEKTEKRDRDLLAKRPVTYTFRTPELGVYEVSVTGKINAYDTTLRVDSLKDTSKLVSASPPGLVYKNINIGASTQRILSALIRFRVNNSWLKSNKIASVRMVRWHDSKWTQLDTTETTKDTEYTSYEAKTPGFSSFAIVGVKEEPTPTETPTPTAVATPAGGKTTPVAKATQSPGFEVVAAMMAVTWALYLRNKKRR